MLESLQLTAAYSLAIPAGWIHGDDVIIALSVSTGGAQKKFTKGVKIVKPYLRYAPQPDL